MILDATQIIKRPLVTEKSNWEGSARHRYSFEVVMSARKPQIKAAVEELYKVRVEKVSTQIRKGHERRMRYGPTVTPTWKKATVQLHPDDKIELF